MIGMHFQFKFNPETMFLAANIFDRFLSAAPITPKEIQLLGGTCLFIASKYEEKEAISARNLVYLSKKAFTEAELFKAEGQVMTQLDFDLSFSSAFSILLSFKEKLQFSQEIMSTGQFLLEIALLDFKMLGFSQLHLATTAIYLAFNLYNEHSLWTKLNCEAITGITESMILPCAFQLLRLLVDVCQTPAMNLNLKAYYASSPVLASIQKAVFSLYSSTHPTGAPTSKSKGTWFD